MSHTSTHTHRWAIITQPAPHYWCVTCGTTIEPGHPAFDVLLGAANLDAIIERAAAVLYDAERGPGAWMRDEPYELTPRDYHSEPYVNQRNTCRETARAMVLAIGGALVDLMVPGCTDDPEIDYYRLRELREQE